MQKIHISPLLLLGLFVVAAGSLVYAVNSFLDYVGEPSALSVLFVHHPDTNADLRAASIAAYNNALNP